MNYTTQWVGLGSVLVILTSIVSYVKAHICAKTHELVQTQLKITAKLLLL